MVRCNITPEAVGVTGTKQVPVLDDGSINARIEDPAQLYNKFEQDESQTSQTTGHRTRSPRDFNKSL